MKILNKLFLGTLSLFFLAGCQAGLVYDEVPESIYNDVDLTSNYCNVKARELFENQIYAINWEKWVEGYINTVTIGNYQGDGLEWTNNSSSSVEIDGVSVAPGETVLVKNSMTTETLESAPEGTLYVLNIYADSQATYSTPNKGYMFDGSKFSGEFELVDPEDNRSQQITLPVRQNEVIVEFLLSQDWNCEVTPQGDAPKLGVPGDFTKPRQYLVTNISRRPDGQEAAKRLYEVRITFLPYK